MKSRGILIIIVVLIAVNAAVFSYLAFKKPPHQATFSGAVEQDFVTLDEILGNGNTSVNTNTGTINTNTTTNTNTSSAETELTSTGMDLSFALPKGFAVSQYSKLSDEDLQLVDYDEDSVIPSGGPPPGVKIELAIYDNPDDLDLLDWIVENTLPDDPELSFLNVKVGQNENGLLEETLTLSIGSQTTYVLHDERIYFIFIVGEREAYDAAEDTIATFMDSLIFL